MDIASASQLNTKALRKLIVDCFSMLGYSIPVFEQNTVGEVEVGIYATLFEIGTTVHGSKYQFDGTNGSERITDVETSIYSLVIHGAGAFRLARDIKKALKLSSVQMSIASLNFSLVNIGEPLNVSVQLDAGFIERGSVELHVMHNTSLSYKQNAIKELDGIQLLSNEKDVL